MKIKGVIFDMDGTLLDTQRIYVDAFEYVAGKQNLFGAGKIAARVCGMNEAGWSAVLMENFPTLDLVRFKKEILEYCKKYQEVKAKKGAIELLEFLKGKGIPMAVASGTETEVVKHHMKLIGAFDYFKAFVGGEMVENGKPAPDIFLCAAKKLGIDPENCAVFEDSPLGIKAGYNAKMTCFKVPDIGIFDDEANSMVYAELETLDRAIEILEKMI